MGRICFRLISAHIAIFLFFTSCSLSMSEEEKAQYFLPEISLDTSLDLALKSSTFVVGNWPDAKWWENYDSEELNALIEQALEKNPTIQAMEERVRFAEKEAVIARADLFPLVSFNATDQWSHLSKNGLYRALNPKIPLNAQLIDLSLSFSYEFDFWGKYRNLYRAALDRQRSAVAEKADAELIAATSLAQVFFAFKTNLLRKNLYQMLSLIRKRYFTLQSDLLSSSILSKLPPLLSEEAVFQAEQFVAQIDNEIEQNKHTMNILAGVGPDTPLPITETLPSLPKQLSLPEDISLELLCRRPDLMAQIAKVESLAHEVGAAKAAYWPNINLLGFLGLESVGWSHLWNIASKTLGLTPGLNLPVYTAGAIGANIDAKKALFYSAVFEYNRLTLNAFQQVADLISLGKAVYREKQLQTQTTQNAKLRYQLTHLRQKEGLDSALQTYLLWEEYLQKELENVALLYQQYVISIHLIKALGGGYK